MSFGFPRVCGSIIARVFREKASRNCSGLMLYVPGCTSRSTGVREFCTIGLKVVEKVHAGVITSSPGFSLFGTWFEQSAETARRFAEEPEFVRTLLLTPKILEKFFSNSSE